MFKWGGTAPIHINYEANNIIENENKVGMTHSAIECNIFWGCKLFSINLLSL